MMKLSTICLVLGLVQYANCQASDVGLYEFCSSLVRERSHNFSGCDPTRCQGKPGKRGPTGLIGPKGDKGDVADSSSLEREIERLKEQFEFMWKVIPEPFKVDYCSLGVKNSVIPDSAFTASSEWDANHGPRLARLDAQIDGNSRAIWAAKTNRVGEWIQVDLGQMKSVSGVVTQGRPDLQYKQWVTKYKVTCGDNAGRFQTLQKNGEDLVFNGNSDNLSIVVNMFPTPMTCRYVRIYPQAWNNHISTRIELLRGDCASYF